MSAFFDFNIPRTASGGFGLFSLQHFSCIACCGICLLLMCIHYKYSGRQTRHRLRLAVTFSALGLELLRSVLLVFNNKYDIGTLPLHLCALSVYINLLHARHPSKLWGQFIYAFCMPGAVAAILFPDWNYYPLWHFMSFCCFTLHMLIVAYPLMLAFSGELTADIHSLPQCLLLMLALALPVFVFDRLTNTNYMFLNWPSEGSPLEWFSFMGRPGYVLGYLPLFSTAWLFMYRPYKKEAD